MIHTTNKGLPLSQCCEKCKHKTSVWSENRYYICSHLVWSFETYLWVLCKIVCNSLLWHLNKSLLSIFENTVCHKTNLTDDRTAKDPGLHCTAHSDVHMVRAKMNTHVCQNGKISKKFPTLPTWLRKWLKMFTARWRYSIFLVPCSRVKMCSVPKNTYRKTVNWISN